LKVEVFKKSANTMVVIIIPCCEIVAQH